MIKPVKDRRTGQFVSKVWLSGKWLAGFGFNIGAVATAKAVPGKLTIALVDCSPPDYRKMVRNARRDKYQIIQVFYVGRNNCIEVFGQCLERAGFFAGDYFMAECSYGLIQITRYADNKRDL